MRRDQDLQVVKISSPKEIRTFILAIEGEIYISNFKFQEGS